MELAGRVVARQLQQSGFVKGLAHGVGGSRHDSHVGKADLTFVHRLAAPAKVDQSLADCDPIPSCVGGHAAVESDPVDGADGALIVPVIGLLVGDGKL